MVRVVTERLTPGERATFTIVRGNKRLQVAGAPVATNESLTEPNP